MRSRGKRQTPISIDQYCLRLNKLKATRRISGRRPTKGAAANRSTVSAERLCALGQRGRSLEQTFPRYLFEFVVNLPIEAGLRRPNDYCFVLIQASLWKDCRAFLPIRWKNSPRTRRYNTYYIVPTAPQAALAAPLSTIQRTFPGPMGKLTTIENSYRKTRASNQGTPPDVSAKENPGTSPAPTRPFEIPGSAKPARAPTRARTKPINPL